MEILASPSWIGFPGQSISCELDFPGGPVVNTLHFQCRGRGFDPWSENWEPASSAAQPKKKKILVNHYRVLHRPKAWFLSVNFVIEFRRKNSHKHKIHKKLPIYVFIYNHTHAKTAASVSILSFYIIQLGSQIIYEGGLLGMGSLFLPLETPLPL